MENPYSIAKNILQSPTEKIEDTDLPGRFTSIDLYGTSVNEKCAENGICNRFHLKNESGVGNITLYNVFPGIELVYNDMHMAYCNKHQKTAPCVVEINYCKEGRCECLFGKNRYCYMSAGNLSFCSLQDNSHQSEFPTSHYHGITVTLDFSMITKEMNNILELLNINLAHIKMLSEIQDFTIIRANSTVEHIFSELYTVPTEIRQGYIRVKVLELLLILTQWNPQKDNLNCTNFSKIHIECIKSIHKFLVSHFNEHYTINYLSEHFGISPTVMKKCFKGVYGDSIYAYMKLYRLRTAEQLLKETDLTIGEIATQVGYTNPNKFTSAFHSKYKVTPTEYRKRV